MESSGVDAVGIVTGAIAQIASGMGTILPAALAVSVSIFTAVFLYRKGKGVLKA